ncbi:MAG: FAD-dependent oxidoreductase [Arenimonas sp.]
MQPDSKHKITIAGAGLAGALLATLLARKGWQVEVFEKRPDPRVKGYEGGRSINLALAERGLHALREAGLNDVVMQQAVMMRGRMVHMKNGDTQLQRYGKDDSEVIWSVHRGELNITLLNAAEAAGAKISFNHRIENIDFDAKKMTMVNDFDRSSAILDFHVLIGADGAGSGVRTALKNQNHLTERFESLGHSYKELEIPPNAAGEFQLEANALHIWPRGGYMCIALPNTEKTFTVTLFLPNEGDPSFATLPDLAAARKFFETDFADALPLIPNFDEDFINNPTSGLSTLYCDNWHLDGRVVLLGDAAHAMVPFHGQGMNCAFEDCLALVQHIEQSNHWEQAFSEFEQERKPNALAIQTMALENYIEMRDRVDDPDFLLQRQLERTLAERHPGVFIPRYAMVSFSRVPYRFAFERGLQQRQLLIEATRGKQSLAEIDVTKFDEKITELFAQTPRNTGV